MLIGNRVVSSRMQRMTTKNSSKRQPTTFAETMQLKSFQCIVGTAWVEAA
jgi:hypothetical protein